MYKHIMNKIYSKIMYINNILILLEKMCYLGRHTLGY